LELGVRIEGAVAAGFDRGGGELLDGGVALLHLDDRP
jgi:hypothetical protein